MNRSNRCDINDSRCDVIRIPHKNPTLQLLQVVELALYLCAEFTGLGSCCLALFDVSALNAVVDRDSPRLLSGRAASESTTTWLPLEPRLAGQTQSDVFCFLSYSELTNKVFESTCFRRPLEELRHTHGPGGLRSRGFPDGDPRKAHRVATVTGLFAKIELPGSSDPNRSRALGRVRPGTYRGCPFLVENAA